MHISQVRIRNFRNFLRARFLFTEGVNTLIGENGSGKTNALHALRLLLDDSLPRNATQLRESDFCRALGDWRGHWIVISADFERLDPSEGCQLLKHQTGHMNGTESGTFTLYFRPKEEVRKRLHQISSTGDGAATREFLQTITVDDYEPVMTGRATADLLDDDQYSQVAGDFRTLSFPDPREDDYALLGVRMGSIYSEVSCTFAQALRDVISDLRGYRSNPLLTLLRGTESTIHIHDAEQITTAVGNLNRAIASLPEVKNIAVGVQVTLHSTVGHTYSPSVNVESSLPDSIDKILQRLTLTVGDDPSSSYQGDLSEQGLGGANLIYLALKLLEYEVKLSTDRVAHFLLIEEPEAHIHTHIQKTLFARQPTDRTQVIVSTHSTHISSSAKVRSVNVLARRKEHAEVYQPAAGLSPLTSSRLERYLDAARSTLLFAKGIILVEGDAELVLIPALMKSVFGLSPDEMGISVIAMDSAFFGHVAIVFHPDRIKRRCAIVTDLDQALIDLPANTQDDDAQQRHARESQLAGLRRWESLQALVADNPWIDIFYAKHTFEIDFILAGNSSEVSQVVPSIYSSDREQERVKAALSSTDPSASGAQMIALAKKIGKGWFSILLSEKLRASTNIPEYIVRAIAYASDEISIDAIKRIALYRISSGVLPEDVTAALLAAEPHVMKARELLELYQIIAPADVLSEFMSYKEGLLFDD